MYSVRESDANEPTAVQPPWGCSHARRQRRRNGRHRQARSTRTAAHVVAVSVVALPPEHIVQPVDVPDGRQRTHTAAMTHAQARHTHTHTHACDADDTAAGARDHNAPIIHGGGHAVVVRAVEAATAHAARKVNAEVAVLLGVDRIRLTTTACRQRCYQRDATATHTNTHTQVHTHAQTHPHTNNRETERHTPWCSQRLSRRRIDAPQALQSQQIPPGESILHAARS
jgi:hypothetical protein